MRHQHYLEDPDDYEPADDADEGSDDGYESAEDAFDAMADEAYERAGDR